MYIYEGKSHFRFCKNKMEVFGAGVERHKIKFVLIKGHVTIDIYRFCETIIEEWVRIN